MALIRELGGTERYYLFGEDPIGLVDGTLADFGSGDVLAVRSDWRDLRSLSLICCNPERPECDYVDEKEPDSRDGWCEECRRGTMVSALALGGLI